MNVDPVVDRNMTDREWMDNPELIRLHHHIAKANDERMMAILRAEYFHRHNRIMLSGFDKKGKNE